jgi:hypothetical protein
MGLRCPTMQIRVKISKNVFILKIKYLCTDQKILKTKKKIDLIKKLLIHEKLFLILRKSFRPENQMLELLFP